MRASLPMYERPELKHAHAEFWFHIHQALQSRGIASPSSLDQTGIGLDFWTRDDLVLSQTCGLPYRTYLHDKVRLVATPNFAISGCPDGYYCSYIMTRKSNKMRNLAEWQDAIFAYNETGSQSGFAAAWNHLAPNNIWFETTIQTGSHLQSAESVAEGKADIASIDAVTWRFIERYETFADELTILQTTEPTPGLPYITSQAHDPVVVRAALTEAVSALSQGNRDLLSLKSIITIPKDAYLAVPTPKCRPD